MSMVIIYTGQCWLTFYVTEKRRDDFADKNRRRQNVSTPLQRYDKVSVKFWLCPVLAEENIHTLSILTCFYSVTFLFSSGLTASVPYFEFPSSKSLRVQIWGRFDFSGSCSQTPVLTGLGVQ